MKQKEVFVISDLHIGGSPPTAANDPRGFKICTQAVLLAQFIDTLTERTDADIELVINGDMVDFLAEEPFAAFTAQADAAVAKLERIMNNECEFFTSLRYFLEAGHQLSILLGNHDIELALPAVRQRLEQELGAAGRRYKLFANGEGYTIGSEVLIEHGNRYDPWNEVDYAALQNIAIAQSLRMPTVPHFQIPRGSYMVERVINPVKTKYRFIDLLKPETQAVLPILLALEPSSRSKIGDIMGSYLRLDDPKAYQQAKQSHVTARSGGEKSNKRLSQTDMEAVLVEQELTRLLDNDPEQAKHFMKSVGLTTDGSRERGWFKQLKSFADLMFRKDESDINLRLPALYQALSVLQNDRSFDPATETLTEYLTAAQQAANRGFKYVLMGHTHFARKVKLQQANTYYYNSGTWADLMRVPNSILTATDEKIGLAQLRSFMDDLLNNRLAQHLVFVPTYVHLVFDDQLRVLRHDLHTYQAP